MKQLFRALPLIFLASFTSFAQDREIIEETESAMADAQRAATMARLTGSAEGLYRGCKSSVELRSGRPSEPDLSIAFNLASECNAFAAGVAAATALSDPYLVIGHCKLTTTIQARNFIDAVVKVVQLDPLLIGQTTTQKSLTLEALMLLSKCRPHEG